MSARSAPECPRLFEAEAARDGRLTGAARAKFEAHALVCASCAREARALERLADALRNEHGQTEADELHVRRERTRLLAAFDASLMPPVRVRFPRAWLTVGAILIALLGFVGLRSVFQAQAPSLARVSAPVAVPPALARVEAELDARWTRARDDRVERITLESGTLTVRVTPTTPSRRLLVSLPDGELEDIGTVFTVTARAGHTTSVSVHEGRVVLRLRDQPPRQLGAGESWSPSPPPARSAPSAALRPSAPTSPPRADPAAGFRAALSALNAAESARAAGLFADFLREHPSDARAEDAAYLRVIALQRAGKHDAMQSAAAFYLSRYPRGFRRAEVERLTSVVAP
jgi:hypothetical protein